MQLLSLVLPSPDLFPAAHNVRHDGVYEGECVDEPLCPVLPRGDLCLHIHQTLPSIQKYIRNSTFLHLGSKM